MNQNITSGSLRSTVNTGAFDNLAELSLIAHAENVWFHVDGAFGSLIILDSERRHLVNGIQGADSLAFDFHKWLHCPTDVGCVLIRDKALLQSTFSMRQSYLPTAQQKSTMGDVFWDFGPELSRSFRALKVWFTFKEHGAIKLGRKMADNCKQAQYLVSLLEKYGDIIHIVRPISLNIVNFRFEPDELNKSDTELLDCFNSELLEDIKRSGIALLSSTYIYNRFYIRVAILSHRVNNEDFDIFVETMLNLYRSRTQMFITGC
ncbi:unnamed protein product [Rotaria socialis]|uniref:Uncharacterized protein n=2 Tax=Rotaria socialis TaxID=392032 RepID=A0A817U7Y8_9BILA|nr:unnamed protein product [Rotaria socialis]CAF3331996.1 unnamed protein product [Rotaria socialis]CAF3431355.1 unnamed protein product [Rotaria socialis]CAF4526207.1 unnamed protein product [Rotaria socialis]CAF4880942.1 unnamed protein product [Rotaria socialis]